jgi:hypothetical protein
MPNSCNGIQMHKEQTDPNTSLYMWEVGDLSCHSGNFVQPVLVQTELPLVKSLRQTSVQNEPVNVDFGSLFQSTYELSFPRYSAEA